MHTCLPLTSLALWLRENPTATGTSYQHGVRRPDSPTVSAPASEWGLASNGFLLLPKRNLTIQIDAAEFRETATGMDIRDSYGNVVFRGERS